MLAEARMIAGIVAWQLAQSPGAAERKSGGLPLLLLVARDTIAIAVTAATPGSDVGQHA